MVRRTRRTLSEFCCSHYNARTTQIAPKIREQTARMQPKRRCSCVHIARLRYALCMLACVCVCARAVRGSDASGSSSLYMYSGMHACANASLLVVVVAVAFALSSRCACARGTNSHRRAFVLYTTSELVCVHRRRRRRRRRGRELVPDATQSFMISSEFSVNAVAPFGVVTRTHRASVGLWSYSARPRHLSSSTPPRQVASRARPRTFAPRSASTHIV